MSMTLISSPVAYRLFPCFQINRRSSRQLARLDLHQCIPAKSCSISAKQKHQREKNKIQPHKHWHTMHTKHYNVSTISAIDRFQHRAPCQPLLLVPVFRVFLIFTEPIFVARLFISLMIMIKVQRSNQVSYFRGKCRLIPDAEHSIWLL